MSLFDFMFPEQSQAESLRAISAKMADAGVANELALGSAGKSEVHIRYLAEEIHRLQIQNGELSLAVLVLLKIVKNVTGISQDDIAQMVLEADKLDGKRDGKLDIEAFRRHFGVGNTESPKKAATNVCPACNRITSMKLGTCVYCGWDLS